MDRLFLILMGLIFISLGSIALINPTEFTASFGMEVSGRHGSYETRGIYGGVSIAASLLFFAGAIVASLRRPALIFIATYAGGYMIARTIGIALDGMPAPFFFAYIAFELFVALVAIGFLMKSSSAQAQLM